MSDNSSTGGAGGALVWPDDSGDAKARSGDQPRPVRFAVILMVVGAAVALLYAAQTVYFRFFVPADEIREQIVDALKETRQKVTDQNVATMDSGLTIMLIVSVVIVGVWALMAWMNNKGHGWARVTATALGILNVPWTMILSQGLFQLVGVLVGLLAVLLLWLPASREWFGFRASKA